VSPDIDIPDHRDHAAAFRTPNTESLAIKRWASDMTAGSHHMIMYLTSTDVMPPGTVSATNCGIGGASTSAPVWTYATQTPQAEVLLPTDDGTGKPLAQDIPANTAGFFQMHYFNATDQVLTAHVTLDAEALEANVEYTQTAAYVTYNASISIPPLTNNHVESRTCEVPAGVKFWLMSTHAHKQAVRTAVKEGGAAMFESTDWEHPGTVEFMTPARSTRSTPNQFTWSSARTELVERHDQGRRQWSRTRCAWPGYYQYAAPLRLQQLPVP
jgi:hypothetical protein